MSDPPHAGVKPLECQVCHEATRWHPTQLNHAAWQLDGAHLKAECSYCHGKFPGKFEGTPRQCVACHREDYDGARYPGHDHFALTCADCHDTRAFKPALRKPEPEQSPDAPAADAVKPVPAPAVHRKARGARTRKPKRKTTAHREAQHRSTPPAPSKARAPTPSSAPPAPVVREPTPRRTTTEAPAPGRKPDATSHASRRRR